MPMYEDKAETARIERLKKRHASLLSISFSTSNVGRREDKALTERIETEKKQFAARGFSL